MIEGIFKYKQQHINILCSTDNNYAPYCGVMLTSLLENNRQYHIDIYILTSDISSINRRRFEILEDCYDCSIVFLTPDKELLKNCPIKDGDHVSMATYYRIICDSLLPASVEKILYLDCDIIVNTDILELYHMDMGGSVVAACIDSYNTVHRQRLGLEDRYFCAGVMLFDLYKFREGDFGQKCLDAINENPDKFLYHDQDAFNLVLNNHVEFISPKWNMMSAFLRRDKSDMHMSETFKAEIEQTLLTESDKLIVHYEYLPKPWQKWVMMPHPFTKLWYHYRSISPWPDAPINCKVPLDFKFNVVLLRVMWRLGLKNRPKYYLV